MKGTRTTLYLALLLAPVLTLGTVASVGQTQARVAGAASVVHTVLRPLSGAVTSDCLIRTENQAILLGTIAAGETITAEFTLETAGTVAGPLICNVTDDADLPILADVQIKEDETAVEEEQPQEEGNVLLEEGQLQMEAGTQAAMILTVTAPDTIPAARTAQVRVEFGELRGIFQIELEPDPELPDEENPENPDTVDPDVEDPNPENPDAADPDVEDPNPENPDTVDPDVEDPNPENPDAMDPDEEDLNPENPNPEDPGTEDSNAVEPQTLGPGETTGQEPGEDVGDSQPEQPQTPEEEPVPVILEMKTPGEFELNNRLPIKLTVSGPAEGVCIGLGEKAGLPPRTRFSMDGGENWYLLWFGGYLEIPKDFSTGVILLDFSASELPVEEVMVLQAWGNSPSGEEIAVAVETAPQAAREQMELVPILTWPDPEKGEVLEAFLNSPEDPQIADPAPVLENTEPGAEETPEIPEQTEPTEPEFDWNTDHWFSVPLPAGWENTPDGIRYGIELLERNEEGTDTYVAGNLNAVIHEETGNLIVYLGDTPPRAGTYRLTLECNFEDICFYRTQITFFINYSTRSDVQNEEVPDNE